jgi:hypothetical protein
VSDYCEAGKAYHNVYKYQVDDPSEWCATTVVPNREPYNFGGTAGQTAYFKIWNVTDQEPVCGTFQIVAGDVKWKPLAGPNTGAEIHSVFTAYLDGNGTGSGQLVTTLGESTRVITINCVQYEGNEVWMSGFDATNVPVIAYARAGSAPIFNQWTNPSVSPSCAARWSELSEYVTGTIKLF